MDDLPFNRDLLERKGYKMIEEATGDCVRWVKMVKRIESRANCLVLDLELLYTMNISDDPFATWDENVDYFFEGAFMRLSEAREYDGGVSETTITKNIRVFPKNLREFERLSHLLASGIEEEDLRIWSC